jgi:putative molybdopterin biosynthesis protein
VGRQQGLIVQPGNPKNIETLLDLTRADVRFINRQRGAGTRVLLEYELKKINISTDAIRGFQQEEYTHLNVAAAIASNRADCGLGIAAAAHALELDFIPLFQERYDLVIPKIYADSDLLEPLFSLLVDEEFRKAVAALPGYDISPMGSLIYDKG